VCPSLNTHFVKAKKDELFAQILYFCSKEEYLKIDLSKEFYKLTCSLHNKIQSVTLSIEFKKAKKERIAIVYTKIRGDLLLFYE